MAQIGFTHKTEPVYDRFEKLRSDYAREHGRTYAPGFLTVLMDAFEVVIRLETVMELDGTMNDQKYSEELLERAKAIEPVSLQAYAADAEANNQIYQGFDFDAWVESLPDNPENETE